MIAAFKILAELHLNQILVASCGLLIARIFFAKQTEPINSSVVYTLGIVWFALIGAIAVVIPFPSIFIWTCSILLILSLIRPLNIEVRYILSAYQRFCLKPLLFFLPFAAFLLIHFSYSEIQKGIDPWLLVERTASYKVPDHYLQWIVSNNLYDHRPIESGFNPDGKQMWSAGDRPVLIGLLEATFSQLTNHRSLTLYYLRVVFLASLLFLALNSLLKEQWGVDSRWKRVFILSFLALHPFFAVNMIFTWPKMAGLAFGMLGFQLFANATQRQSYKLYIVSGLAFALGTLCHTAAIFCLAAAVLYYGAVFLREKSFSSRSLKQLASFFVAFLLLTQLHSVLLENATNQTGLLQRVQFCRGGSYAFVTPVESLFSSCKKYLERQGWEGVIADREQTFQRAFAFRPSEAFIGYKNAFTAEVPLGEYLRSTNSNLLLIVPDTIGHFSLALLGLFSFLYLISIKLKILPFAKSSLLLPIGFLLLTIFCCMLGEFTEMSSHVVPYIVPLFIITGILIELSRLSKILFCIYAGVGIMLSLATLLARANLI